MALVSDYAIIALSDRGSGYHCKSLLIKNLNPSRPIFDALDLWERAASYIIQLFLTLLPSKVHEKLLTETILLKTRNSSS